MQCEILDIPLMGVLPHLPNRCIQGILKYRQLGILSEGIYYQIDHLNKRFYYQIDH